jgi:hypothetical protein
MGNVIPNVALSNKLPNVLTKTVTRNGLVIDATDPSLVAGWEMEIGPDGTVKEATGNFDGTVVGDPVKIVTPIGCGLELSNDAVTAIYNISTSTTHTISFWVRATKAAATTDYMMYTQGTGGDMALAWFTTTVGQIGFFDGTWRNFGVAPNDGKWHHVGYALDGVGLTSKMYIDGEKFGSDMPYTPRAISSRAVIGANNLANSGFFVGDMSQCQIHNVAKPASWFAQQYRDGLALL